MVEAGAVAVGEVEAEGVVADLLPAEDGNAGEGLGAVAAVLVTEDVALADAIRGITMFHKLSVPLLGVVENMAWYELPDGTRDYVFGEGGGVRVAAAVHLPATTNAPSTAAERWHAHHVRGRTPHGVGR